MLWRRPLISSVVVVPHLDTSSRGYVVPLLASSRHFCLPTSPLFTPGKVHVRITAVDGTAYERDYHEGTSLMEALRDDPTLPVDAAGACNGTCQCSTCHVIMRDHEWFAKAEKLYPVTDTEQDCLDRAPGVTDASRLGCQIILTEDLDGLEVDLPKTTVDLRWQAAYHRSTKK